MQPQSDPATRHLVCCNALCRPWPQPRSPEETIHPALSTYMPSLWLRPRPPALAPHLTPRLYSTQEHPGQFEEQGGGDRFACTQCIQAFQLP